MNTCVFPAAMRALVACLVAAAAMIETQANAATSDAGATLAARGAPGVAPCGSCHGAQGEGNAQAGFPRIAGQPVLYLQRQLESFADGRRQSQVMTPIAKAKSQEQRQAAAAYYSALQPGTSQAIAKSSGKTDTRRARTLANIGDEKKEVQACGNCHGPDGRGEGPMYPYLAGLSAQYLTNALNEWKSGSRNSDPSGQMQWIAKQLSDPDIAALAHYFGAMAAPSPLPEVAPSRASRATPVGGPPVGDTQPVQGIGTEQGSPITGGTQGAGGAGGGPAGSPSGAGTTSK